MSIHKQHKAREPDDHFERGRLEHIVAGNEGRVLDGRRTPGYIESYDSESAMFIWRITDFEDKGKCWIIPAEEINNYQFRKGSSFLSPAEVERVSKQCERFKQKLNISKSEDVFENTHKAIEKQVKFAVEWIHQNSGFFKKKKRLDIHSKEGDQDLFDDIAQYLKQLGVFELEIKTAEQYLLNPYSGEWMKGMKIAMAEMGLIDYFGGVPRTKDIFADIGDKVLRKKYVIARMAFIRAVFGLSGFSEVSLYRGMSSEIDFYPTPSTLLSATFSLEVAKEFASMNSECKPRSAYCVKFAYPVDRLFMTFFETKQFNERYLEQEAVICYRQKISF